MTGSRRRNIEEQNMKNEYKVDTMTVANPVNLVANSFQYDFPNMVKIRTGKHGVPKKATKGSAGFDLRADLINPIVVNPNETVLVSTGLSIELAEEVCAFIMPRSGLAYRKGITIPNSPGLIDSDYRGDICVLLRNDGNEPFIIEDGDRIAQLMIMPFINPSFVVVDELSNTYRNTGGFGSTGLG
jgi:dUTP pyrophosphatase